MSAVESVIDWFVFNLNKIVVFAIAVIIVFAVYKFLVKQLTKLTEQEKLERYVAHNLTRILQGVSALIVLLVVLAQFGVEAGIVAGLLALAGGTIIGFASMNTIGNAIAGIIIMVSNPFEIGDRVFFKGQFSDVADIDLIYTRMRTLDDVQVSVPNLELLKYEIENFGRKRKVRRRCSITTGYELDAEKVETALLEAASKVEGVLKDPKPYVWITNFKDFAVEYTLYVFINQIKRLQEIESDLRRTVLKTCKSHKIEIVTPTLIRTIE